MIIPALTSWKVAALGKIVGTHFEIHASVDALGMAALAGPHAVFHGAGASPFRGVDSSRALYSQARSGWELGKVFFEPTSRRDDANSGEGLAKEGEHAVASDMAEER